MDEKLKSRIRNIMYDYIEENELNLNHNINDTNLNKLKKHIKCVLETRYQYKEEISNLKIIILEIQAEEIFNS